MSFPVFHQYLSVVVGVPDAFFEADEELTGVTDAADQEPDRRDDSHDVRNDRRNVVRPRKIQDNVSHDVHENRVAEKSLETVRNQKGNASARPDEHHCKVQTERHGDGGADGGCDHLRNRAQNRTENTEKLAPVTQFEELPHGETTCFAPAVQTISGQCHEYADGSRNRPQKLTANPVW